MPSHKNFWNWFVDTAIPQHVKQAYSPRAQWRDRPFGMEDARFFSKGIRELSSLLTEERSGRSGRRVPAYFSHERFRSAYLLYFLPLQAAKFMTLFERHPRAVQAALEHGRKQGVLRLFDIGAGPGTASLAFLLSLMESGLAHDLPPLEFQWFDQNETAMKDGVALIQALSTKMEAPAVVHTHSGSWSRAAAMMKEKSASLTLIGHLLNELSTVKGPSSGPEDLPGAATGGGLSRKDWQAFSALMNEAQGGGTLIVEPAARRPSQRLSQIRDTLIEEGVIPRDASSIHGPCLHAGRCPLAIGKDWCHFSVPKEVQGRWFRYFSQQLGSIRQWLKFSYLWLASAEFPAEIAQKDLRRVISDPLITGSRGKSGVLICEPERPGRFSGASTSRLHRGDLISLRNGPTGPLSGASGKKVGRSR